MDIDWNYIWAAIAINFLMVYVVPKLITKPTGIKVVDDAVLYLNTQKSFLLSSSIIVGLTVYLAHYWVDSQGASQSDSLALSGSPTLTKTKF
ncbi:hypothetical protein [Yellowstone lake phycodnavirus 2]|jgi:hypothetical protein|uniref:hypothetical protein n=1 Tax=Yellowstone lake phycodnavirus 2 TaxID=1586714 RepID=UPI0006EB3247|nr:hypothetical protein AR678_gp153 [Yellowstone lake phycodnavirus 2]BAT22427.1 hypothetical protein [Yellowstone lake phycodnavirus 2]